MSTPAQPLPSSYRDPAGFMFTKDGVLYRQINKFYREDYDHFISSGCYDSMVSRNYLIPHTDVENLQGDEVYRTIKPVRIPFISYPWEWSFDMLKDAGLLTLEIVKESLKFGMILKDATPFNIQWLDGKPVFIDTLSFARYDEAEPWIAYRQYCECFLGPLLLMHYSKLSLHNLMLAYPEGIPLGITRSFLPLQSRFSLHTWLHIHMHAKVAAGKNEKKDTRRAFSRKKLDDLLTSLEILTKKTRFGDNNTTWSGYYDEASRRVDYLDTKIKIVKEWVDGVGELETGIDLGANDGMFSEILATKNIFTVAADFDAAAVNNLYKKLKEKKISGVQPLVIDLSSPSPAQGFADKERPSFSERVNTDIALALALVHHLAIGKNIPLNLIAGYFSTLTKMLIIEFVPKSDPMIEKMLAGKKDIYHKYTKEEFEAAFAGFFSVENSVPVGNSGRILYKMKRR